MRTNWDKNHVDKLRQYVDQDIPQKEIAKLMGVSTDTIKRAIGRLKDGTLGTPRFKGVPKSATHRGNPFAMRFAPARPISPTATNDDGAIADFIAQRGIRRFGPGASGEIHNVISWLDREFGIKAKIVRQRGGVYIGKRKMTLAQFYAYVDRKRAQRGLPTLSVEREAA
jgi:hypothetical protein